MSSPNDVSELIAIEALRIGMYVELDVGWLSHPFPTSSFKITSDSQLDTIRGLGLPQLFAGGCPRVDVSGGAATHSAVLLQ